MEHSTSLCLQVGVCSLCLWLPSCLTCNLLINFHRLELNMELPQGETGSVGVSTQASVEQDDLSQRLARLRQVWTPASFIPVWMSIFWCLQDWVGGLLMQIYVSTTSLFLIFQLCSRTVLRSMEPWHMDDFIGLLWIMFMNTWWKTSILLFQKNKSFI